MIERDELLKMAREAGVEVCFDSKFGSELYFSAMASWPAIERLKDAILERAALEFDEFKWRGESISNEQCMEIVRALKTKE